MVAGVTGKYWDECLSMEWVRSRMDTKVVIEDWRKRYNDVRPHLSLGKMTPGAFARMIKNQSNQEAILKN
jgi:putative transposase